MAGALTLPDEGSARRRARTLATRLAARVGGAVFVLWAVATVTFFALRLIPGDPALAVLGGPGSQAGPEALALVRERYGFDQPLLARYARQLGRLAVGDLGTSSSLHEPVAGVIASHLGATLTLALCSLAAAWALALLLAAWSVRGGRVAWTIASGLEIASSAVPHFWLGAVLILAFSTGLGLLPPISVPGPVGLILPAATLAIPLAGFLGQVMRESLAEALGSPFVFAARVRGETPGGVFRRHALRHAVLPAIGLTAWAFGSLISGAVVVETIFARGGLGRSLLDAVRIRDLPLVTGIVLVVAAAYCAVMLVADLAERLADPRTGRP